MICESLSLLMAREVFRLFVSGLALSLAGYSLPPERRQGRGSYRKSPTHWPLGYAVQDGSRWH